MPSNTLRLAGSTCRSYVAGDSAPAHESNSCTALAPASICARSEEMARSAKRSSSSAHSPVSPSISALVAPYVREGRPSMR